MSLLRLTTWFSPLLLLGAPGGGLCASEVGPGAGANVAMGVTQPFALGPGERLVFQVQWKWFARAGRIQVAADDPEAEQAGEAAGLSGATAKGRAETPPRRILVNIASDGAVAWLFAYQASGESFFDPVTGRMLSGSYESQGGRKRQARTIEFDAEKRIARYRDTLDPTRDEDIPLPEGDPVDLITCLVTARHWRMEPGDTREILVQVDKKIYPIRLRAVGRETLRTGLASFPALLIVPEPVGVPRGLFRAGGGMRIWIEDAPRALPLRVEVKTRSGPIVADLVEYQPPRPGPGEAAGQSLPVAGEGEGERAAVGRRGRR